MTSEDLHFTLAMIKPHTYRAGKVGEIISRIEDAGFKILILKSVQLRKEGAEVFYQEHKDKDFFKNLVNVMCSGPVIPIVLLKHDCVFEFRKLIGDTDPTKAEPGTIRHDFGDHSNLTNNAIHGSATDEDARREINFFFGRELKLAEKVHALDKQQGVL